MSGLIENPVVQSACRRAAGPCKGSNLLLMAGGFALLILVPMAIGVCGCTMFTLAAIAMILAASLGVGNSAFGALTVEREKKTLDSLRLTQLSSHEVLLGKLLPEFGMLAMILATMAPTVLIAGIWGQQGLVVPFAAVGFAALAGVFASVLAIFMSSLFATTSQAVVAGWITKGVWLLLTPLLDLVVGAVFVQNVSPPVFTSLNPLAAFGALDVPEAAHGARLLLPVLFPAVIIPITLLLWMITAKRFENGMANSGGLTDREVHSVYRKGFGGRFITRLFPALRNNPSFLRELAAQVRAGAGRWPGYCVFLVLFLAPTFYARSWSMNDLKLSRQQEQASRVEVVDRSIKSDRVAPVPMPNQGVTLRIKENTTDAYEEYTFVHMRGHKDTGCMRLCLFGWLGVAPPKDALTFETVRVPRTAYYDTDRTEVRRSTSTTPVTSAPNAATRRALGMSEPMAETHVTADRQNDATTRSLHVGIAGAIALLLLYLSIRFSAFLATAVTGERARRTWEDLALTGISVREAMKGKVLGAILLPALQMTIVFPVLGYFVASGNLAVYDILALYVYALALSVTAAMLGLWASSRTSTSHDAHLRALCLVMAAFFVLPVVLPYMQFILIPLAVVCATMSSKRPTTVLAWGCIAATVALAPQAISPLTAAVSFMPSLTTSSSFLHLLGVAPASMTEAYLHLACGMLMMLSLSVVLWNSSMDRLTDAGDGDAIAAENGYLAPAV